MTLSRFFFGRPLPCLLPGISIFSQHLIGASTPRLMTCLYHRSLASLNLSSSGATPILSRQRKRVKNSIAMADSADTKTSLVFKVIRGVHELIPPSGPTPNEFKELSDIDDQEGLRFQIPMIHFYRNDEHYGGSALRGRDPAKVIKEALGKALVAYYPFAGRLREKADRKLVVECNGEGVLFIEADADVTLDQFGEALQPPFPCLDDLLFDVPGFGGVLHSPLLLFQVTRLTCGGFILAVRLNHTMADAAGLVQFLNGVAELARGAQQLSVQPVWERHLLCARDPPRVTCVHREYDEVEDTKGTIIPLDDLVNKSFFFGLKEISALRRFVPPHLKSCTTFEVLAACVWRCRTIAIQPDPEEVVRFICVVNARSKYYPPLPNGYYGNAFALPVALSSAERLTKNPIGYALDLVRKAKADVTDEYMRSLADLMHIKGRPHVGVVQTYLVSDVTRAGFSEVDFGWGPAAYGGPARAGDGVVPGAVNFHAPFVNYNKGEKGIVLAICLPGPAMERFVKELHDMLSEVPGHPIDSGSSSIISS